LLDEANQARARGKHRRAIALLRQVLAQRPDDIEVAFKLAELLASEGENFESWSLFRGVGKALLRERRHAQCLATFREATRSLPFEFEAWRITAELERKLGRDEDAHLTLLEGRRQFRTRFDRAQAMALLSLSRDIEPWDHGVVMDLARLYAQTDQPARALHLLENLAIHSEGRDLRAVRRAQWQITRSFHHLRGWLKVALADLSARSGRRSEDVSVGVPARVRW
jgi:tetratricopeptide (TPR) repeat protein